MQMQLRESMQQAACSCSGFRLPRRSWPLPAAMPHPSRQLRLPHEADHTSDARRRFRQPSRGSQCTAVLQQNGSSPSTAPAHDHARDHSGGKRVLVVGGTGRVGASTVSALLKSDADLNITVASRSAASFDAAQESHPALRGVAFMPCDIDDTARLAEVLQGFDLVIHTAGPFQWKLTCSVLEAAIVAKVPYIDVADDADFSAMAKGYHEQAKAAGVPAITTAGIYPGTSNVMAAHLVSLARKEYDEEGSYREPGPGAIEPQRLRFSYYTAGSGGVGPTILATSMLLAGEPVVAFKDGKKVIAPPISEPRTVDFGIGIGKRQCYLYNLPETASCHANLRVPSVSARFGTAPWFWNVAMWLTARLAPKGFLEDRDKATGLAKLAGPWVRAVDPLVGERVAMLVEVELDDGKIAAGLFAHRKLSESVGFSIAAFARAVLDGETQPGVWFPEEKEAIRNRPLLLERASEGCFQFLMNKAPWEFYSAPKRVVMGIYLD